MGSNSNQILFLFLMEITMAILIIYGNTADGNYFVSHVIANNYK